jgi:soluble lytic murein transglycosylase
MPRQNACFYLLFSLFLCLPALPVAAQSLAQQRLLFQEAQAALEAGRLDKFQALSGQLQDYPIAHYLRYAYLKRRIAQVAPAEVNEFLSRYPDSPAAEPLRREWLLRLAENQDWAAFASAYTPQTNTVLRCHALRAWIAASPDGESAAREKIAEEAKKLWLAGHSQPKECDPAFAWLSEQGMLDDELRWQRVRLALEKGQAGLAEQLARPLPEAQRLWLQRWRAMEADAAGELAKFDQPDSPLARDILRVGLKKLARQDAPAAHARWLALQAGYAFSAEQNTELARHIALWAVEQDKLAQAEIWLAAIPPGQLDDKARHTRLRLVLLRQDWPALRKLYAEMPAETQNSPAWRYWRARASDGQAAREIYQALAAERGFYAFLAAERLDQPYSLNHRPLQPSQESQDRLLAREGLQRARELFAVNWLGFARGEWQALLDKLPAEEQAVAAYLAAQWGWHDRAIVAAFKSNNEDALELRFPVAFYDEVMRQAHGKSLSYAWVYAIIRQESAFQTDAVSSAGALGLMQLLPGTARDMAKKQQISLSNDAAILDPVTNIRLGAAYLEHLLGRFEGNHILATVAYNAGPTRAKRWAGQFGCLPPDVWVELIPFQETRDYVQRVMSYTPLFEYRLLGHEEIAPMPLEAVPGKGCGGEESADPA